MKHNKSLLLWLLVITSVLVALVGGGIKYAIFKPLGIDPDCNIMELPFRLMADEGLKFTLRYSLQNKNTEPPSEEEIPVTETVPADTAPAGTEVPETEAAQTEPAPTQPPETEPVEVEESWFDDVLFIGDSRTVGLQRHGRLGDADYFCDIGMSYFNMFGYYCKDNDFYNGATLEYLLKTKTYGKIYIALGMNGSGNPEEMVDAVVDETIAKILELQPDAKIILHSIIAVGPRKEARAWYFVNEVLLALNEIYASKADGETVFYIDPNDWMTDEEGNILETYCDQDQCHLTPYGYEVWSEWILDTAGDLGIP